MTRRLRPLIRKKMREDVLIFTDLDGTLIRSAKKRRETDIVVEYKNGEEITCISAIAAEKFSLLKNVVPVTTRSVEQYLRIGIPAFSPECAVCSNGGNLLINGETDTDWHKLSERAFAECESEMAKFREALENDRNVSFEIRLVDGLFLFTKSSRASETIKRADFNMLNCFSVGEKVYAFPKALEKGAAVKRFVKRQGFRGKIICAGDSLPDVSMLNLADIALFPDDLNGVHAPKTLTAPREHFTDFVAETLAEICNRI